MNVLGLCIGILRLEIEREVFSTKPWRMPFCDDPNGGGFQAFLSNVDVI